MELHNCRVPMGRPGPCAWYRDGGQKTADRLRATELLGKAQGDFIERTENKNLNVHAQLDRLEVLTDKQIDELLAIVEGKKKALLEGAG